MSGHRFVFDEDRVIVDLDFWDTNIVKDSVDTQDSDYPGCTVVEVVEERDPWDYRWIARALMEKEE